MTLTTQASVSRMTANPSRRLRYLPITAAAIDTTLVVTAALLAAYSREAAWLFKDSADVSRSVIWAGPAMLVLWSLCMALTGSYERGIFGAGTEELKRVANATLIAAGLTGVGCYLAKFPLSRGFFVLAFGLGLPAVLVGRLLLRRAIQSARRRGVLCHRVLIAGSPDNIDEIARVFERESWLGYQVVGALTPPHDVAEETDHGVPVLGNADDVKAVVESTRSDTVFIAGGAMSSANQMRRLVWQLEGQDTQVVVAPSVTDISGERVNVRPVGGLPLMHIDPPRWSDASRWGKRTFDLISSLGLIVLFSPLLILAALQIKLHDRGAVLFRQTRIGRDGHRFDCFKFRTMVSDAEAILAQLHQEQGYSDGLFKMKDDPRITRPGRWLRRFSVDELPQLFNVLRGEMSLVGPRPPLPLEVERYEGDTARRLHVRPGMTGLWQVSGRSDLSWSEAIRLDLYYVDNWSMMQDLSILTKTLGAVVSSRGAY